MHFSSIVRTDEPKLMKLGIFILPTTIIISSKVCICSLLMLYLDHQLLYHDEIGINDKLHHGVIHLLSLGYIFEKKEK